jgi:simple sugar transport system permease protein
LAGKALVGGAFGSRYKIATTFAEWIPLILTGLSVTLAFRAGFFNIGAEGQFTMGALIGAACGARWHLPWPLVALGGAVAGALFALIPGWLKIRRGAPEIITTIMLNYIALQIVVFSLRLPDTVTDAAGNTVARDAGGWLIQASKQQPETDVLPDASQIPALLTDTPLHWGLPLALLAVFGIWWLLYHTERGFAWRAAGEGPLAARVYGMKVERNAYSAIALSGALSGLAGALEVAGVTKFMGTSSFGYGYTAIAVALLANLNPIGILPAAFVFAMLTSGGGAMERNAGVPAVAVSVIIGVVVFALAAVPRLQTRKT